MDDSLFACGGVSDLKDMSHESISLFKSRGFKLQSWFQIRALNLHCRRIYDVVLLYKLAKLLLVQNPYLTQNLRSYVRG